jgi:CrcB protein
MLRAEQPIAARRTAAIALGGGAGALGRAALAQSWTIGTSGWPWPTFIVNLVGAFLLGAVGATAPRIRLGPTGFLLGTGFCGALTTFSTFQVEVLTLIQHGDNAAAGGYLAASLTAGLLCAYGGRQAMTLLTRRYPALGTDVPARGKPPGADPDTGPTR